MGSSESAATKPDPLSAGTETGSKDELATAVEERLDRVRRPADRGAGGRELEGLQDDLESASGLDASRALRAVVGSLAEESRIEGDPRRAVTSDREGQRSAVLDADLEARHEAALTPPDGVDVDLALRADPRLVDDKHSSDPAGQAAQRGLRGARAHGERAAPGGTLQVGVVGGQQDREHSGDGLDVRVLTLLDADLDAELLGRSDGAERHQEEPESEEEGEGLPSGVPEERACHARPGAGAPRLRLVAAEPHA